MGAWYTCVRNELTFTGTCRDWRSTWGFLSWSLMEHRAHHSVRPYVSESPWADAGVLSADREGRVALQSLWCHSICPDGDLRCLSQVRNQVHRRKRWNQIEQRANALSGGPRSPPWVSCGDSQALNRESVPIPEEQPSLTLSIAPKMPCFVFLQNSPGHRGTLMAHRKWSGHHLFIGFLPKCLHKSFLLNKELISFLVYMRSLNLSWKLFSAEITKENTGIAYGLQCAAIWFPSHLPCSWPGCLIQLWSVFCPFITLSRAGPSSTASHTKEE